MTHPALSELQRLAASEELLILWAGECGARARGYPSSDSPDKVRFIYAQAPARYLRVFEGRETVGADAASGIDLLGWDVRKVIAQLRKGHHELREWLSTDSVLLMHEQAAPMLLSLADRAFLPRPLGHHYLSCARQDVRRQVFGGDIRLRTLLETVRGLLATQWMIERGGPPPLSLRPLLAACLPDGHVRDIVDDLVALKAESPDNEIIPPQEDLHEYLLHLFGALEQRLPAPAAPLPPEDCDRAFHDILAAVWPGLHLPDTLPA